MGTVGSRFNAVRAGLVAGAIASIVGVAATGWAIAAPSSAPASFTPIVPCRLVDTRPGAGPIGPRATPIGPGEVVTFAVRGANGQCDIAAAATAIVTNVTIDNPTASSYLTVFPADAPRPLASNLNWIATSSPTPNQVTVGLSADGSLSVYNDAGTVNLLIDVVGIYSETPAPAPTPALPTVLGFDASWAPAALVGANGNTILTPTACKTASYVAGAGESALVTLHATGSPNGNVNDVLYVEPMVSKDGAAFVSTLQGYSADSLANGTASPSVSKLVPLNQGSTYVFGAGFASKSPVNISAGYCQGTVTIVAAA